MAELHKLDRDPDVSITMKLSEAITVGAMLAGAIEQLGPHAGSDAAIAQLVGQAGSALAAVKAATAPHVGESDG